MDRDRSPGTGSRGLVSPVTDRAEDGLQAVFLANREAVLRFLRARGAGDEAEDILQDVWLRIARSRSGPVAAPMAYLYRTANSVMIDRYRAARQARRRERDWAEMGAGPEPAVSDTPSVERTIAGRQYADAVARVLAGLPQRAAAIFRRHRVDGLAQRAIAEELGVSVSTVESDLRSVYRALAELRERIDEA